MKPIQAGIAYYRPGYPFDVKGFAIVTAVVLVAIGISVGLVGGLPASVHTTHTYALGTVAGRIVQVGLMSATVPGVVIITNISSGARYTAAANRTSGYSVKVPAGTYRVTGRSARDFSDGHEMSATRQPVHVTAGATSRVNLYIQIR